MLMILLMVISLGLAFITFLINITIALELIITFLIDYIKF